MKKHLLSKSTFMRGLQCEKSLYLNKHNRNLKDEIGAQQQAIFSQGTNVGELAQELFPGGVDCTPESYYDFQKAVIKTQEEIENGSTVIYEAAFQFEEVLVALDILVKDENGWKAYEVKSSTSVSDTYRMDASLQYYVIKNSGIDLQDISIVYINNQYVKNGKLSFKELFTIESVMEDVKERLVGIPNQIKALKTVLKKEKVPAMEIGAHCTSPYQCDFMGHCWKHVPDYSVFNISRLGASKKFELYEQGILEIKDVPEDFALSENQRIQVEKEISQTTHIDKPNIETFLNELNYPLYFLDFETMGSAIPIYDDSRPYQQLVFQYSLHIQEKPGGDLIHKEYLAVTDGSDPRLKFMEQLVQDCGTKGDVIVYNIGFEKGKLNELINTFPQYEKGLNNIVSRLKDLMIPFQSKWFYKPEMQGSYSIKKVLPALVPELSYNDLEIKEGGTASNVFTQMAAGTYVGDLEKSRKDLLDYCRLDTLAMVRIVEELYNVT
jgi:hypothetical protein